MYLSIGSLLSQQLNFEKFTAKDGLLSNEVYNLHQDKQGYIWLFTNYGAMKYNGKEFKQVLVNLPIKESFIYCIYENSKGQKWIANSNANVYEIRNDSAIQVKGIEKISNELKRTVSEITQIIVDDSSNIYLATKHVSYKLHKNKNYQAVNLGDLIPNDSILFHALELKNGILSVLNYPGYDVYQFVYRHDYVNLLHTDLLAKKNVFKIKCKMVNNPRFYKRYGKDIYFSFYTKMVKIHSDKTISEIAIEYPILNFIKDNHGHLWVATLGHGLFEYDSDGTLVANYFQGQTVNCVITDSQNGLWVSSTNGLYHCKDLDELNYSNHELLGKPIRMLKTIDSNLFIGNNIGELLIKGNGFDKKYFDKSTFSHEPQDVIKLNSNLLFSYKSDVRMLEQNKQVFDYYVNDKNADFYAYKFLLYGLDTLIAVQRKGLMFAYNRQVFRSLYFDDKVHDCVIRKDEIFVATESGIYILENNKYVQPKFLSVTKNKSIITANIDGNGMLWFGSKGNGLYKLDKNNRLVNYSEARGLPSDIILNICFSENSNELLLCTNKGVFYQRNFDKLSGDWYNVYNEVARKAIFLKDYIYIATENGLCKINKRKVNENKLFYFNELGIYVNGIKVLDSLKKEYNSTQNNIEFHFDLISHDGIKYKIKYELKGNENKSQKGAIIDEVVSFQNLPSGSYTFCAAPDVPHYPANLFTYIFEIKPIFYKTWWFILLSVFLFSFVIISGIWFYVKIQRSKSQKKAEIDKLIFDYKLIALKAQINPHFMSNCLTAIQHLIINGRVNEANHYLAKFSLLVRQVLNFSSKSLVTLNEELEITELNIDLEQLRFENKFEYEIEIEDSSKLNQALVPPLILQPIVENAIWHGLLPIKKVRSGVLKIKISTKYEMLYIIIEDNGIGRSSKMRVPGNIKESKGIQITRQRIQNLNNLYKTANADLIYEDLKDDYGNSLGTRVIIVLPSYTSKDE